MKFDIDIADIRERRRVLADRYAITISFPNHQWRVTLNEHAMAEKHSLVEAIAFGEGIAAYIEHERSCHSAKAEGKSEVSQ